MAILRSAEIRKMNLKDRAGKLQELRKELLKLKSQKSAGASLEKSSGKIKAIKKTIAKIYTIVREESKNK